MTVKNDNQKTLVFGTGSNALIVEGGAIRGVFSCGVLDQFIDAGFSPFDSFWGVSAGATNLGAYLARMPGRNYRIYSDYSCRPEFLSAWRFLRGGDLISIDWLWKITMAELGLDTGALASDGRPLFLVLTRQDNGAAEYHLARPDNIVELMKASSAMPVLYRRGVEINGHRYVDGGVSDAIPVAEAIRRGAKNIMVLRSQPYCYTKSPPRSPLLLSRVLKKTPQLIEPMLSRAARYNDTLALIRQPPQGVRILEVCPPDTFPIKRLTQKTGLVEEGYNMGLEAGKQAISDWQTMLGAAAGEETGKRDCNRGIG